MPTDIKGSKDYYAVLGVGVTASFEEVKRAYRKQAFLCHPDRGGSPSRMREVNEAWGVLGDAERRRAYDLERRLGEVGTVRAGRVVPTSRKVAKVGVEETKHPVTEALFSILRRMAYRLGQGVNRVRRFFRGVFRRK